MAFDGSGNYSIINTFTPNSVISSSQVNANFSDIAAEGLTKVLPRDGQAAMTGQLKATDGTVGAPGITFGSDTNTGFRRSGTDVFRSVTAGADGVEFGAAGQLNALKQVLMSGDLSPAQITGNQNDYDPTNLATAYTLRLTTDASRNITGLAGGVAGRTIVIHNVGSFDIVLTNEDAGSTAANRFALGADTTIGAAKSVTLKYDGTSSRWRACDNAVNVADGSLTPRKLSTSAPAAPQAPINLALAASVAGNALTVAVKGEDGADPSSTSPVLVPFRNATVATGTPVWRAITSALSLTISSGSTLGTTSSEPFRLWVVLFDDAGTLRLGLVNCRSGTNVFPLGQFPIAGSTAEGGAGGADSAHVIYTGTAVAAKGYVVLGYLSYEDGLGTAGTWSAGPTRLHLHHPGGLLPGQVIQHVINSFSTSATGTTALPLDDTIPQNAEGDEFVTQAITPTSKANVLDIETALSLSNTSSGNISTALFQDTTANALAALALHNGAADGSILARLLHRMVANTVSATTFKARAGASAGTVRVNGRAGNRLFGGVNFSHLRIAELVA